MNNGSPRPRLTRTTTSLRRRPKGRFRVSTFLPVAGLIFMVVTYVAFSLGEADVRRPGSVCPAGDCLAVAPLTRQSNPVPAAKPCPYCDQDAGAWREQTRTAPPAINGAAAAVVEGGCGRLVYGLRQDERLPPASLTKIVTALAVVEEANLGDSVPITVNGWDLVIEDGSSVMGLEAGMVLSVGDLLYGLLLPSGNDAALALAQHLGGSQRLIELMNQRVTRLGLVNSRFMTPDGRDARGQYSSALDLALLGREFLANPELRRISASPSYKPDWPGDVLWNGNYLLQAYPEAFGVKIGYTEEAGFTIVAAAERKGRDLLVTVLGSSEVYADASRLFDWAFANTRSICRGDE